MLALQEQTDRERERERKPQTETDTTRQTERERKLSREIRARLHIDRGGCFVHQENLRPTQECATQTDQLSLSDTKVLTRYTHQQQQQHISTTNRNEHQREEIKQ
jgi:hypothetical protein